MALSARKIGARSGRAHRATQTAAAARRAAARRAAARPAASLRTRKPAIPYLGTAARPADVVRALRREGCVILRNLVAPEVVDRITRELEPYLDATPHGTGDYVGFNTKRTSALITKSETVGRELAIHPLILDAVNAILGERCQHIQLATTQAVSIGPRETVQAFHRDDSIYPFKHPSPESVVSTVWALTDFTEANGATRVVPGSHRWGDKRLPKEDDAAQAVMPKGSVVIYLGSVYHGGGASRARSYRTGLILGYSLGWLRQEENQYLVVPPEVAKRLPEKLQRLIGYTLHPPYLGWVEMQDPHIVLEGRASATMAASELYVEGAERAIHQHTNIRLT
ncbi:MAG TPA: phytanoyl-CoA dioxygenase family protein [Alphaproteobacteria bacterium]|nr:phytanoyl-CoA dioxygenase family protein [Alphaproteobacteria bacterium]